MHIIHDDRFTWRSVALHTLRIVVFDAEYCCFSDQSRGEDAGGKQTTEHTGHLQKGEGLNNRQPQYKAMATLVVNGIGEK